MKRIYPLVFSILLLTNLSAQINTNRNLVEFEKNHIDTLTKDIYLDSTFCIQYELKLTTKEFKRMLVYTNFSKSDTLKFKQVYDIRWKFNNNDDAIRFFTDYQIDLAENMDKVKFFKLKIKGIRKIKVYQENEQMRKMSEALGLEIKFYCFLFVYKNYVAKVYVSAKSGVKIEEASIFAIEAANRLKTNSK